MVNQGWYIYIKHVPLTFGSLEIQAVRIGNQACINIYHTKESNVASIQR